MDSFTRYRAIGARLCAPASTLLLTAAIVTLAACGDGSATSKTKAQGRVADADLPAVLATVDGDPITMDDLRPRIGSELDKIDIQYRRSRHELVDATLKQVLLERVVLAEARKQRKTFDEFVVAEAGPGGLEPSEVEISAWYAENQSRIGDRTLAQVRPQIAQMLRNQRGKEVLDKLQARLNAERNVVVNLEPYRITLNNTGAPAMGNDGARVTVVEFADFQCPYCATFAPSLKRLMQDFGDQVQIVYRHYPIPSLHPNAFKAAEASMCANDQGKFWELHDLMYAEKDRLAVSELKEKARRIGLDERAFDKCLDSGKHVEKVQTDLAEGESIGVSGTPAIFVNGVLLPGGAVAYQALAGAVELELARTRQ